MSSISSYNSSLTSGMYSAQRPSKADMEAKLSSDFSSSDTSGNGTLNLDELTKMLSSMPKPPNETSSSSLSTSSADAATKAKALMKSADTNGDGELSLDELKVGMEKMHSQLQAKADGTKQRINSQSDSGGGFEQDMQSLSDAIKSGDLTSAKNILSQIESHKPQSPDSSPSGSDSSSSQNTGNTQRNKDFSALSDALNTGDTSSIQSALKTIQSHMKQNQSSGDNSNSSGQGFNLQAFLAKLASNYSTQSSAQDGSSVLAISA